MLTAMLVAFCV